MVMLKRCRIFAVLICFCVNLGLPPISFAESKTFLNLPVPGTMLATSSAFTPVLIKGVQVDVQNPLQFNFIVEPGDSNATTEQLKAETLKMVKYFLAAVTVPEKEMWVNLSPYEKDRIIPQNLGVTEMGRDMLAQDYILKQLTASLVYPEKELGKSFWQKTYQMAQEKLGTTNIPVNTFNKVWIIPDNATVYEHNGAGFVVNSHLKVMLEEDYLALSHSQTKSTNTLASQAVRDIIIPAIETEVNTGKNFANLRQIYNSMILAIWYKQNLKATLLNQVYANKNKIKGIDLEDKATKQKIYAQYLEAFKRGVYNYIKEDRDPITNSTTPRKYFSGGLVPPGAIHQERNFARLGPKARAALPGDHAMSVEVNLVAPEKDAAMLLDEERIFALLNRRRGGEKGSGVENVFITQLDLIDLGLSLEEFLEIAKSLNATEGIGEEALRSDVSNRRLPRLWFNVKNLRRPAAPHHIDLDEWPPVPLPDMYDDKYSKEQLFYTRIRGLAGRDQKGMDGQGNVILHLAEFGLSKAEFLSMAKDFGVTESREGVTNPADVWVNLKGFRGGEASDLTGMDAKKKMFFLFQKGAGPNKQGFDGKGNFRVNLDQLGVTPVAFWEIAASLGVTEPKDLAKENSSVWVNTQGFRASVFIKAVIKSLDMLPFVEKYIPAWMNSKKVRAAKAIKAVYAWFSNPPKEFREYDEKRNARFYLSTLGLTPPEFWKAAEAVGISGPRDLVLDPQEMRVNVLQLHRPIHLYTGNRSENSFHNPNQTSQKGDSLRAPDKAMDSQISVARAPASAITPHDEIIKQVRSEIRQNIRGIVSNVALELTQLGLPGADRRISDILAGDGMTKLTDHKIVEMRKLLGGFYANLNTNYFADVFEMLKRKRVGDEITSEERKGIRNAIKRSADAEAQHVYAELANKFGIIFLARFSEGVSDGVLESMKAKEIIAPDIIKNGEMALVVDAIQDRKMLYRSLSGDEYPIVEIGLDAIEGTDNFVDSPETITEQESGATSTVIWGLGAGSLSDLGNVPDEEYAGQFFANLGDAAADFRNKVVEIDGEKFYLYDPELYARNPKMIIKYFEFLAHQRGQSLSDLKEEIVVMKRGREEDFVLVLKDIQKNMPGLKITEIKAGTMAHGWKAVLTSDQYYKAVGQEYGIHKTVITIGGPVEAFMNLAVSAELAETGAVGAVRIFSGDMNKSADASTDMKDKMRRYDFSEERKDGIRSLRQENGDAQEIIEGRRLFTHDDVNHPIEGQFSFINQNGVFHQPGVKKGDGQLVARVLGIYTENGQKVVEIKEQGADAAMIADSQERFWDGKMDSGFATERFPDDRFVAAVKQELRPGARILTLGEGPTLIDLEDILEDGYHVMATDLSRNAVHSLRQEQAAKGFSNLDIRQLDIRSDFDLEHEGSFDVVVSRLGLGMYSNDEEFLGTLRRVRQVMSQNPNARLIFQIRGIDDYMYGQGEEISPDIFVKRDEVTGDAHVRHFWREENLRTLLQQAGFKITHIDRYEKQMYRPLKPFSLMTVVAEISDTAMTSDKMGLKDLPNLQGKKVAIRVDFNVPIKNGRVMDDTRIRESIPTILFALQQGARVYLMAHLGRPQQDIKDLVKPRDPKKAGMNPEQARLKVERDLSLAPVAQRLKKLLREQGFTLDAFDPSARTMADAHPTSHHAQLLENLRFNKGEETKDKEGYDPQFAEKLFDGAEVFILDGMSVAHRAQASVVGAPQSLPRAMGFLVEKEHEILLEAKKKAKVQVMGGAKVSDKIGVIKAFLDADPERRVLIGGAMANAFLKAQGKSAGKATIGVDEIDVGKAAELLTDYGSRIILPLDYDLVDDFMNPTAHVVIDAGQGIPKDWLQVDIGSNTAALYARIIAAEYTIWNGPMGAFDAPSEITRQYGSNGSRVVAYAIAQTKNGGVVGGGDSVAAYNQLVDNRTREISEAKVVNSGGAALEFLEGIELPGLAALSDAAMGATREPVGGINLDANLLNLKIKRDGNGVPLPPSQQPVFNMKIDGFMPVIINVTPVKNLPLLLGIAAQERPALALTR